ncbi:MAG: hypothetical protein A3F42_00955 [Gammaproteobacteria bacterium RIFCSPHIGHO2_12_FULL_37_34]|nr:MAG: hypothetical protein A3F42_00955 [Gammaproteobacteria bacterium RIFCSPHIGHO2_12_FULL_37_34]
MSTDKKHKRLKEKNHLIEEEDDSSSGQGGQIEFHDFITNRETLSLEAEKHVLAVHNDIHELRVKKQKEMRELRQAIKEGKNYSQGYGYGRMGGGHAGSYKPNPILADKAQFSGIDKQVISLPNENTALTNEEKRDELQLQLQHQLHHTYNNVPRLTKK